MGMVVGVVVGMTVGVVVRVSVGLDCVDVCLESARMVVLVFRRRVWAVLATRFIVGIQKVAI